jgi:7-cyano-7-deazaguanine synthase
VPPSKIKKGVKQMTKGVILLSGGLDSSALLAYVLSTRVAAEDLIALSLKYGQKHGGQEIPAAWFICKHYGVRDHRILHVESHLFDGAQSTLVGEMLPNPHMTYQEIAQSDPGPSPTYVPFRNGIFISMATALALSIGAEEIYMGVHAEDARNWAYPDCTPEFTGAMANALYVGTYHKVRLVTPFSWMMKKEIVKLGLDLKVPYELTWTCYEGESAPCLKCPSCIERIEAFRANGAVDPLVVQWKQLNLFD